MIGQQLSMLFAEDEKLFGTPADIIRCDGAKFAYDVETTGLRWWQDQVIGIGIVCPERGIRKFIVEDLPGAKRCLQAVSQNPATTAVVHNCKFDSHFMGLPLWEAKWKLIDTGVMSHLYDSRIPKALRVMEQTYLGTGTKVKTRGKYKGAAIKDMPLASMAEYCLNDCQVTLNLEAVLQPKLAELKLLSLLAKEMRYAAFLQRVERRGMLLNRDYVTNALAKLLSEMKPAEQELFEKSNKGVPFNWHSNELLSHILYEGMGIPKPKDPFAGADGVYHGNLKNLKYNSTSTSTFLLMEKANHPLGELIMSLRETDILAGMLTDWLDLSAADGLIHTNFNQTGTRTGRLSSSKPNLQNIPSQYRGRAVTSVFSGEAERTEEYNLRLGLVARPGHQFVSVDHKQQEMRMFAILAQEPLMLETMRQKLDIHREVAKAVWGIGDDLHREWSKMIGFGLIYGMRVAALEMRLNKTKEEAKQIAEQYWTRFPRIMPFLKETAARCERQGYIRYWSNRIWRETDPMFCYKGANAAIQGGCADVISIAAMRCQRYLDEVGAGAVVSIVHDELLIETPEEKVKEVVPELLRIMEVEDLFHVPFAADVKVGSSYGNLDKYKIS